MQKLILIFFSFSLYAYALQFKETKYIEAFELESHRYGSVSYENNQTIIHYKDGKIITKNGHVLTVENKKHTLLDTIDLRDKPQIALYFTLTQALFSKRFALLEDNFNIKQEKQIYYFLPKGSTAYIVNKIELHLKQDGSVLYFVIDFKNKDNIKIEII